MDGLISLAVILTTLAAVTLVFIVSGNRRRARRQRLTAHCEAHGWVYYEENERLRQASVLKGPGWRLEAGVKATLKKEPQLTRATSSFYSQVIGRAF